MIRSIRFTLTLWYAGILTVSLCIFGSVLYTNVSSNLKKDIDGLLNAEAFGLEEAVFSFWKAEWETRNVHAAARPTVHNEIEKGNFPDLVMRWANATVELETVRPARLISRDGEILAASNSLSKMIPISSFVLNEASRGRRVYETFVFPDGRLRLVTWPVIEDGALLYFIQVATSLHQADLSLHRLRGWLFWLIPTTLMVTSAVGWALSSIALRPVSRMIIQAERISVDRLHERIDVPQTQDELEKLAAAFNKMLERLESAFKRMRQFSAAASHELRTPLTVLRGELELLLRKPRVEEEYQRVLRTNLDVINEMTHVVEQLLAIAHAGDGEWAIDWKPVELNELIRQVRNMYESAAETKKITVEISESESLQVRGEKSLLQRLLANLLENAIKHTPSGGKVSYDLTHQAHQAVIKIADTGAGIPAQEIPRIFEKFFTHRSPTDRSSHSTGIGLGLCRWIAEVHQGSIEVNSAAGYGATFTVVLPLIPPSRI